MFYCQVSQPTIMSEISPAAEKTPVKEALKSMGAAERKVSGPPASKLITRAQGRGRLQGAQQCGAGCAQGAGSWGLWHGQEQQPHQVGPQGPDEQGHPGTDLGQWCLKLLQAQQEGSLWGSQAKAQEGGRGQSQEGAKSSQEIQGHGVSYSQEECQEESKEASGGYRDQKRDQEPEKGESSQTQEKKKRPRPKHLSPRQPSQNLPSPKRLSPKRCKD